MTTGTVTNQLPSLRPSSAVITGMTIHLCA